MKGKPFVLNAHGSLLGFKKYLSPGLHQVPYKVYDGLTLKLSARRADAVVVSSRFEYEDAVAFGIDREKLHIIPMGIDVPEETAPPGRPGGSPLRILFVGRLARVRRVELLLQAAKELKIPYQISIVGGEEKTASLSKGGYMRELKNLAADLGIADRVTFTGTKKPEELRSCYGNADVFVYPSLYENFGQPLLEAASYGLPVVATKVGVARELVQDGETGFTVGDNPREISDRLISLSDPAARASMGRNIRELSRKHFDWHNVIQRYIDIYRSF
ncbi:MAG: glycosyltransferase family 4 protein [Nitrospinae bacterium]|nr:glycosyltransferase family 4 protein [Nitrospinota bacterium]